MTLVELMVAVSILAIGLVAVARAFLIASAALDTAQHRISAIRYLETRMAQLQEQADGSGGVEVGHQTGTLDFHHRTATWEAQITPMTVAAQPSSTGQAREGAVDGGGMAAGADGQGRLLPQLAEVQLSLAWREGARPQEARLGTYLPYRQQATEGLRN